MEVENEVKRQLGVMLYYQVVKILREGKDQVLPEDGVCELFQVGHATVRYALGTPISEGLIFRKQGQETYAAEATLKEGSRQLLGFTEERLQKGISPGSGALSAENTPATGKVVEKFNIQARGPDIMIKGLQSANDEPIEIQTSYTHVSVCPGSLEEGLSGSLYTLLENKCHICLHSSENTYYVGMLKEEEAKWLRVSIGSTVFTVDRVTIAFGGMVVKDACFMRGDRYRVLLQLRRDQTQDTKQDGVRLSAAHSIYKREGREVVMTLRKG